MSTPRDRSKKYTLTQDSQSQNSAGHAHFSDSEALHCSLHTRRFFWLLPFMEMYL
ncbi:hypothetical protein BDF14DRAFT_1769746, partial [Spinellus fusiger]